MGKRPLLLVSAFLVAVVWIRLASGGYESPPGADEPKQGAELLVTGQVCRKEEQKIWLKSVKIQNYSIQDQKTQDQKTQDQKTTVYEEQLICELPEGVAEQLPLGSHVVMTGIFVPFSESTNPGGFSAKAYYRSLGVGAQLKKAELFAKDGESWLVREAMYRLRKVLHERLYRIFPQREASIMGALLLGEKSETDEELEVLYKRSGILHILSISSLHITIIGMSLYKGLRKLGLPLIPCAVAGAFLLILYGFLTGFSVSACRAIGMYLIRMAGMVCGRTYDLLTALGMLAAGMVLYRPFYLENTGFLLSFSAVLGIGLLYPALAGQAVAVGAKYYGESRGKILLRSLLQTLKQNALSGLSATLATMPVLLWFFYEIPVWSVLINLFVLPFVKPLLILGIFSLVPGMGFAGLADRVILWWYETVCALFDKLPFGSWNPGRPQGWQIWVYYGMLGIVVWLAEREKSVGKKAAQKTVGRSGRTRLWQGVGLLTAAAVFLFSPAKRNEVIFLDVGQGDCCLVRTKSGGNYLFDCGSSSRKLVGEYVLLPALKYYGITRLDAVFVSHPDSDHMNGIQELLTLAQENHLELGQLCLPAVDGAEEQFGELLAVWKSVGNTTATERKGLTHETAEKMAGENGQSRNGVVWIAAGDSWKSSEVCFLCLHPKKGYPSENANAYSTCVYADFGTFSLLLTGDVEGEGEKALLAEMENHRISHLTLLKVSHHGSRNSTSPELLQQLSPVAAVISCGSSNRYGHPHRELLERLTQQECQVFCTAEDGALLIGETGEEVRIRTMSGNGR